MTDYVYPIRYNQNISNMIKEDIHLWTDSIGSKESINKYELGIMKHKVPLSLISHYLSSTGGMYSNKSFKSQFSA